MPPSIDIFWFSGTGNTRAVAEMFAAALTSRGAQVRLVAIEDVLNGAEPLEIGPDSLVGIGYPVHAFNAPRVVFEFIARLPKATARRAFIFKCPGDSLCDGGATTMVRGALRRRGYEVFHESLIVGPANVAIRFDDRLVRQLYLTAQRKIVLRAGEILAGTSRLQKNGLLLRIATYLFSAGESQGARWFGRSLKVSSACTLCGKCVRSCPTKNISRQGDKIVFGNACTFCMRCNYLCPVDAISPGPVPFVRVKGFPAFKAVGGDQSLRGEYVTSATRGYFRHYLGYMSEP